jgi:hypothetical protein
MFEVIWEVLTTWYIIVLFIVLFVLIGVFFYLKNARDDD